MSTREDFKAVHNHYEYESVEKANRILRAAVG